MNRWISKSLNIAIYQVKFTLRLVILLNTAGYKKHLLIKFTLFVTLQFNVLELE